MKVAKQAVQYYTMITGNEWSSFYDKLDSALAEENPTGDLFIIKRLMQTIIDSGVSVNEFKMNKDAVKALFDEEGRKAAGEFFTPIVWAKELYTYIDKFIPNWRTDYNIWENSCYSMDTEIFTKRGWVLYDDLKDDDKIYTLNPITGLAEWSGFHNRFKKHITNDLIQFSNSKIDLAVTRDHMLYAKHKFSKHDSDYEFISAEALYNKLSLINSNRVEYEMITGSSCLSEQSKSDLFKLVGMYIGDGSIKYKDNKITCLSFTFRKERKAIYVKAVLDRLKIKYTCGNEKAIPENIWIRLSYLDNKDLIDFIVKNFGVSSSGKFINFDVLSKDEDYFGLLDGLLNSDGTYQSNFNYSSSNKRLAYDVQALGTLCGYTCTISFRDRSSKCAEYRVNFRLSNTSCVRKKDISIIKGEHDVWDLTTDNDNHIFLVRRNGKPVFSKNCGSGNLLRESKANMSNVYMSSLQEDDITLVKNTPEFKGVNAFQCDFLKGIDYDEYNTEFLDKLPPRLKEIIVNDEPLLIICNPPYKTGSAKATEVGRYMCDIGLGRPAYDIFYQFCWRVMRFVEMFNLSNCYYAFFGPLTFFTGAGANILLREFEHSFEFLDGMCISAQEFSDTSESILWGISGSIWKSRGGYQQEQNHKDILLEKKYLLPDGKVGCEGRVLYAPPREKLSDWVAPKDVIFYENAPLMTSHLTFKGSEVLEKHAPKSGRLADNALGTLMVGNTLTRSADQSAILSMPSTIQYVSITEENFWRCVSSYAFRRTVDAGWAIAKKEISAPDTSVEGYDTWLKNALVMFLFEYKSMMSSMRGVQWNGYNNYVIRNKLFYLSEEEIRENCHDEVILADLDKYPLENEFMLEKIKECEPYWSDEIRALFDWCKNYTLFSYDMRKNVGYKGSLDCADAGFQQLRTGGLLSDELSTELSKILVQARDFMRKDLDKFGFVSETENDTDI